MIIDISNVDIGVAIVVRSDLGKSEILISRDDARTLIDALSRAYYAGDGPTQHVGLVLYTTIVANGRERYARTVLAHESGATIECMMVVAGDTWQAFGSSLTYSRRYSVQSLLGVAPEHDDDGTEADGKDVASASKKPPKQAPPRESRPSPPKDGAALTPETRALMVDHIRVLAEFRGKPDTPVGDIARELGGKADGFSEEEGQLLIKAAIAALNELPPAELERQLKAAAAKRAAKKAGQNG